MLEAMGYIVDCYVPDADERCDTFTSKSALDILIAHAVCAVPGLHCAEDCPFSDKENGCDNWNNDKLTDAVKLLNRRKTCGG